MKYRKFPYHIQIHAPWKAEDTLCDPGYKCLRGYFFFFSLAQGKQNTL